MAPAISVCVCTLQESTQIGALLDHLAALQGGERMQVIVADGGSTDGTAALARGHGRADVVIEVEGGRALQLNAAAAAATGELLVFLHADSRLPPRAIPTLRAAAQDPGLHGGNFALRFDGLGTFSALLSAVYRAQRRLGFYYGDSTLWLRREAFDALGGFRELPIMDDYDLVRRLEARGRTAALPGPTTTSARRWQAIGITRTLASWWLIRWLYVAGVPAERLQHWYRVVR